MPRMVKMPTPAVPAEEPPEPDGGMVRPGTTRLMSWASLMPWRSRVCWVAAAMDRDTRLTELAWRVAVTTTSDRPVPPEAAGAGALGWAGAWAKAGAPIIRTPRDAPAI